jgi:peptide/nickel transport system ATP-binding protein
MSSKAWWALVVPGLGIIWLVLGLTLLGQGLEQVLNPKIDTHHLSDGKPVIRDEAALCPKTDRSPVLEVRNLSIQYISKDRPPARAVENVSFTLNEGEILGLVGESGCGKTTLMLGLLGLLPAAGQIAGGNIYFKNKELTGLTEGALNEVRWKEISIIFQGAMNALNPVRSIRDQIEEAVLKHMPEFPRKNLPSRVRELLELVGITAEQMDYFPHQYSGGMRQRAMIAMALACNPDVIIADEPTTALDVMIQAQILELLYSLRKKLGLSVIFVTHDLGVVAELCDRVLVMYGGVTAEYADVDTIYNLPKHPYTQELLKAFPDLTKPKRRLSSIPGHPPRLDELPTGCRFAPRCPAAFERCHHEEPELYALKNAHFVGCHLAKDSQ